MTVAWVIDRTTRLRRPRWSRLHHCKIRDRWLLLVPERVLYPCPTTVDVLQRLGSSAVFGDIIDAFAENYDAPEDVIGQDLSALLRDLLEKGYVERVTA